MRAGAKNQTATGLPIDPAFVEAMENRRDASLRRRLIWCCIVGIFLMAISVLGHGIELWQAPLELDRRSVRISAEVPGNPTRSAAPATAPPENAAERAPAPPLWTKLGIDPNVYPSKIVLTVSSSALLVMFVAVLIYTARIKPRPGTANIASGYALQPSRHRLIVALTWMTLGAIIVSAPAEIIAHWTDLNWGPPGAVERIYAETDRYGYTATNAYGIFFLLACIAVPMRLRESIRIGLPGLAVLLASIVFFLLPPKPTIFTLAAMGIGYAVAGMGWSAWRYADFDARLRAHALGTRYAELTGDLSAISHELSEARRLHESLFPALSVLQGHPGTPVRVSFRYEPAREIGGDFLDVYREPTAEATPGATAAAVTLVVIDVSGHGVTAALAVNRLHAELRRFFSRYPRAGKEVGAPGGPGHLLAELNTYTYNVLADQAIFATAVVVHCTPPVPGSEAAGVLRWANAGHPTGYLAKAGGPGDSAGQMLDLDSTATMLGALEPELFEANERAVPLKLGDRLVLYTDGAVESRDAKGQDFTPERLRQTVVNLLARGDAAADSTSGALLDGLMDAVRQHRFGRITDDTLLVEVRLPAAAAL